MPLMKMFREQHYAELLNDPDCRSGYEYAKELVRFWRGQDAEALRVLAEAYLGVYRLDDNRHSLGIAIYMRELAGVNEKPR